MELPLEMYALYEWQTERLAEEIEAQRNNT